MIDKILRKYKIQRDYNYPNIENPYKVKELKNASSNLEANLLEKWKNHIPQGWYGFAIGRPCPDSWFYVIDEFLDYLLTIDPNFEIYQIKMKFGGICFYVRVESDDEEKQEFINLQLNRLQYELFDKKLIY